MDPSIGDIRIYYIVSRIIVIDKKVHSVQLTTFFVLISLLGLESITIVIIIVTTTMITVMVHIVLPF